MLIVNRIAGRSARQFYGGHFVESHQRRNQGVAHGVEHVLKHLKRFPLIFLLGVFLGKTTQPNALAEVVHISQMFFPMMVEDSQHQNDFYALQVFCAEECLFLLIRFMHSIAHPLAQRGRRNIVLLGRPFANRQLQAKLGLQVSLEAADVPLLLQMTLGCIALNDRLADL